MNTMIKILLAVLVSALPALAAGSGDSGDVSPLVVLFIAFGAMILLFQLVPGFILFGSMIRGLFGRSPKRASLSGMKGPENS